MFNARSFFREEEIVKVSLIEKLPFIEFYPMAAAYLLLSYVFSGSSRDTYRLGMRIASKTVRTIFGLPILIVLLTGYLIGIYPRTTEDGEEN